MRRGKRQGALSRVIIRNPPGVFVPFWNLNSLGHDGEADTKLTIFPVPELENHKCITNTRLGAMECSYRKDIETGGRMRWEIKTSLSSCLNEYPATRMEALLDRGVSS